MLLDKSNAELFKLIAACKDVPRSNAFPGTNLLSEVNVELLINEGLTYTSKCGGYYRVTQVGYDVLQRCGYDYRPDEYRESGRQVLRREACANIMLTLMLAGVDVFAEDIPVRGEEHRYLSSATVRRIQREQGRNMLANARLAGVMGNGFVFYPVADPQDVLYHTYDLRRANNLLRHNKVSAVIYMGADYPTLCAAVTEPAGTKATYRTAYDKFTQPVHLCPCNADGAIQLRVMLQPEYRQKLFDLVIPSDSASPPDPAFHGCDGMYKDEPVAIGIDMNLRRIKTLIDTARKAGKRLHIFSRLCQTEALLQTMGKDGIGYYNIEDEEILSVFGFSSLLADPPEAPYVTKDGYYITSRVIRECKDARKARRKNAAPQVQAG